MRPATDQIAPVHGIRALAALFVVFHHAWLIVWPIGYHKYPPPGIAESLTTWLSYGHFAVTVFIVVSGFCLAIPLVERGRDGWVGARRFLKRRAIRILPPYYASIAVTLVLIALVLGRETGTHWDPSVPVDYGKLWANIFVVNNLFSDGQINGTYWSIAVECHIYLAVTPLVLLAKSRRMAIAVGFTAICAGYAIAIATSETKWHMLHGQYLSSFVIGATAAWAALSSDASAVKVRSFRYWLPVAFALVGIVAFVCRPLRLAEASQLLFWLDFPMSVAAACLLVSVANPRSLSARILGAGPLVKIGIFSYSLYLMHFPIVQLVWQEFVRYMTFNPVHQFALLVVFGSLAALGVGYLFFWCFERPLLRKKSSQLGNGR